MFDLNKVLNLFEAPDRSAEFANAEDADFEEVKDKPATPQAKEAQPEETATKHELAGVSNAQGKEENTDDLQKFAYWIEDITNYTYSDLQANASKIALSITKGLINQAKKEGPNKMLLNPNNVKQKTFYEAFRWKVKDVVAYNMYNIHKMKDSALEGGATEKVLGSVLGGVKLPTVKFAAELKYSQEYLTQYNALLSSLTKIIVNNNKTIAEVNKERGTEATSAYNEAIDKTNETETIPNKSDVKYILINGKQIDLANVPQDAQQYIDKEIAKNNPAIKNKDGQLEISNISQLPQLAYNTTTLQIEYKPKTNEIDTEKTNVGTAQIELKPTEQVESVLELLDSILLEAGEATAGQRDIGQKTASTSKKIGRALSAPFKNIGRNIPRIFTFFKPGSYDIIGYDFGYTGTSRVKTPKVTQNKTIKSVKDILNFIENSHIYEDKSGNVKAALKKNADTHIVKPTKMVVFRYHNDISFEEFSKLNIKDEKTSSNDILKNLPDGTLAIAFWGRIIQSAELENANEGEKVSPRDLLLTRVDRPEWYFLIPRTSNFNKKEVQKATDDIEKETK